MDKLAVELLTLISFFACTDGGRTGAALSLVSKRIHYASRPARFYSVSLIDSATQIELFLKCYQAECTRSSDTTLRIRHLCLSFFGKGINISPTPLPAQPASREEFLASQQRRAQFWRSAQDRLDEQYNRAVPELIRAIAADIETLSLIQTQWRCSTTIDCCFPRLEELTLVGGDPTFLPFTAVSSDRPIYPALKRLHHVPSIANRQVDFFQWATHAPNLTHLRVSRMSAYPEVTANSLLQVMSPSAPAHVFPHLQQIVIQPLAAPPPGSSPQQDAIQRVFTEFCARLRTAVKRARVPTLLFVPRFIAYDARHQALSLGCIFRMQLEWMTRIEGGEGCWEGIIGDGPLEGCWSTP